MSSVCIYVKLNITYTQIHTYIYIYACIYIMYAIKILMLNVYDSIWRTNVKIRAYMIHELNDFISTSIFFSTILQKFLHEKPVQKKELAETLYLIALVCFSLLR